MGTYRARAEAAITAGTPEKAIAFAMLEVADELAKLRAEVEKVRRSK